MVLFDYEEQWQIFVLENLLIAKKLFDKGFYKEARWLDIETGSNFELVAEILFGKENVKYEPFEPVLGPDQELLMEKGAKLEEMAEEARSEEDHELLERAYALSEYLDFYHYKLEIRIPGLNLLWPNQVRKIESGFNKITYTLEKWEQDTDFHDRYPYTVYLGGAGWLLDNGEKVGIWFHTVLTDFDEKPWNERNANEFLIKVWDSLRIAWVFHLRRKSLTKKRLILLSGGNVNAQNRHGQTLLRIKRAPELRKRMRSRNRDRAMASIPNCADDA